MLISSVLIFIPGHRSQSKNGRDRTSTETAETSILLIFFRNHTGTPALRFDDAETSWYVTISVAMRNYKKQLHQTICANLTSIFSALSVSSGREYCKMVSWGSKELR